VPEGDEELIIKAIRRAARFTYHVGSTSDSSSQLFEVEFKKVDENTRKPNGKDQLKHGVVDLKITKYNNERMFCLVLRSKVKYDVWPYVFLCDPSRLSICTSP